MVADASMPQLRDRFAAVVRDGDRCDLGRAALEIARLEYPDLVAEDSLRDLDALATAIRPRLMRRRPIDDVAVVSAYLFRECGFRGDTDHYYDPRNSFLNDVLTRRVGIPITLSVVLMETSTRLGLAVEGVGFPGHFLVRVAGDESPVLLDPFFGGRPVGREELRERLRAFYGAGHGEDVQRILPQALQTAGTTGILSRMLANLLRIYLERDDRAHALATVELMLVLAPDAPEHLRVRGMLYEQLERFDAAAADLRRYLELAPDGAHAPDARERLCRLAGVAVTLH